MHWIGVSTEIYSSVTMRKLASGLSALRKCQKREASWRVEHEGKEEKLGLAIVFHC
jgi:hypothetical protein